MEPFALPVAREGRVQKKRTPKDAPLLSLICTSRDAGFCSLLLGAFLQNVNPARHAMCRVVIFSVVAV
jgi:hypothetical protein